MKNGPYILVKAPEEYLGKKYRGRYVYEHHLVWWKETGQLVPDGYILHHKNEIKTDNRVENFEFLSSGEHSRMHGIERHLPPTKLSCTYCGEGFERDTRKYREHLRRGQTNFFCSKSHAVKQQHLDGSLNKSR